MNVCKDMAKNGQVSSPLIDASMMLQWLDCIFLQVQCVEQPVALLQVAGLNKISAEDRPSI